MKFGGQFWANIILLLTMLVLLGTMKAIFDQSKIALKEFQIRNKPIVGIVAAKIIFAIPSDDPRSGKPIRWDSNNKQFLIESKPVEAQGCQINVLIKNFGTEPALNFSSDVELCIGDTLIKNLDPEFKSSIIMPSQTMNNAPTIDKQSLYDAFINNKKIKIKYKLKYSDLTKKEGLFQYSAELILDNNTMALKIVNADFIDKR